MTTADLQHCRPREEEISLTLCDDGQTPARFACEPTEFTDQAGLTLFSAFHARLTLKHLGWTLPSESGQHGAY